LSRAWRCARRAGLGILVLLLIIGLIHRARPQAPQLTCYLTAGNTLKICHDQKDEGVFYRPGRLQLAYNTQIIALGGSRYAVVLHSEARDLAAFHARTGGYRPGDSIKSGLIDASADPNALFHAPAGLDYRIWGSLTNPTSPLYYALGNGNPLAVGNSGGGNPMVIAGQPGDPYRYIFYLGVASDNARPGAWRNVLLEARSRDFIHFEVLQTGPDGASVWAPFAGDAAMPAEVTDTGGRPIVSAWPAPLITTATATRRHPAGAVPTQGLLGSVVLLGGSYDYFYTDEDPDNRASNHLFVRTARDITRNGQFSAARPVLAVPPEILIRVAMASDMKRWTVLYTCLRSLHPRHFDLCLQYTRNLNLSGPGSLADLQLFDGPRFTGLSHYALGLAGAGDNIRAQHDEFTTLDGALAIPPGSPPDTGGLLTWNELPLGRGIFGAPSYWARWTITPMP
jgi:hypothetical protein